jgi:hypothetical protein
MPFQIKTKMKIFELNLNERFLGRKATVFMGSRPLDISFNVLDSVLEGKYQFRVKDVQYRLLFEIEEIHFEGRFREAGMVCLARGIPRVKVEGDVLREVGSEIINFLGRHLTLEKVYGGAEEKIPGLRVRENDLYYRFRSGDVPLLFLLALFLGFSFRLCPKDNVLVIEVHWSLR